MLQLQVIITSNVSRSEHTWVHTTPCLVPTSQYGGSVETDITQIQTSINTTEHPNNSIVR